jgi:hypothetical protein
MIVSHPRSRTPFQRVSMLKSRAGFIPDDGLAVVFLRIERLDNPPYDVRGIVDSRWEKEYKLYWSSSSRLEVDDADSTAVVGRDRHKQCFSSTSIATHAFNRPSRPLLVI